MNKKYYLEKFAQLGLINQREVNTFYLSNGENVPATATIMEYVATLRRDFLYLLPQKFSSRKFSFRFSSAIIYNEPKTIHFQIDILDKIYDLFEFLHDIDELVGVRCETTILLPTVGEKILSQIIVVYKFDE